jgi:predicted ATP-dependent protease
MDEHDEDVIDMVQLIVTYGDTPENRKRLARFVKNEIAAEREACAKIAEARAKDAESGTWQAQEGLLIAADIRARST